MYLSTMHPSCRPGGCSLEVPSAAQIHLQDGRIVLGRGFHSTPAERIVCVAIRRILVSIDLGALTASIPVRTSIPKREYQNKSNLASTLETHRGLTAHKEPEPPCEAFADDE